MRAACREAGVQWCYSGRLYDFSRVDDAFSTALDLIVAERESGQVSDRVQREVRRLAQAGKPHGRLPYGYLREYDPSSGSLLRQVPDPERGPLITEAANRVITGESIYSISKDYRARGHTSMTPLQIARLLRSPTYAGKRVYRGAVIGEATWPALIDPEKWDVLQGILSDPKRGKFHGSEPAHLLTGIARCGVCDEHVVRLVNRGKYPTYICRENYCVARSQPKTDELVVAVLKARLSKSDALEAIHAHAAPDVSGAAGEVAALESRLAGLYEQAADGSLSPAGLAQVEKSVLAKLDAARQKLRALRTPRRITIPNPGETAAQWDDLPLRDQREIIRSLVQVRVMPARAKGVRFDPQSIIIEWRTE
nr:recombinase family protein [Sinomonas gamaensis]